MIPPLHQLRAYLDAIQPGLFNAGLAALLFGLLWLVRKRWPLFFAKLPASLQAWPALASGAVIAALSASTDGNVLGAVTNALGMAFTGLLSGVLASGIHRTLKESKLSYGSEDIPPKPPAAPLVGIVLMSMGLFGCTPSELQTITTIADDVSKVAQVLCLTEHARLANARAMSVADLCKTAADLAPYIEQAKGALPRAACAK